MPDPVTPLPSLHPGPRARAVDRLGSLQPMEVAALVVGCLLVIGLIVGPLLLSRDPLAVVGSPLQRPGGSHLLGTDEQGRDLLARVVIGMRTSWFAALVVIASGVVIGGIIGLVAGMSGGLIDAALMRFTDLFLALPGPLLALAVVSALGPSLAHLLLAVSIVWWPWYARVVRGQVRATVGLPFVEAARLGGLGRVRIAVRHVLPAAFGPTLVTASLDIGNLVLLLAGLSFLGLGSPQPAPELGSMTARGLTYLFTSWWVAVFPAAGVTLLAFIGNLAGDAVRDLVGQ